MSSERFDRRAVWCGGLVPLAGVKEVGARRGAGA